MKTIVKVLSVLFVLAVSPAAFAHAIEPEAPAFAVGLYQDAGNLVLNLMVENSGSKDLDVKVYDEKGTLVYNERLSRKQARFRLKFNMAEMNDGTYKFVITDRIQEISKTVTLSSQQSRVIHLAK